ncbi:MAG: MBL fold metallo-hydrolase [Sandaracinaceae bacterium]
MLRRCLLATILTLSGCGGASQSEATTPDTTSESGAAAELMVVTSPEAAGAVNSTLIVADGRALVIDAQFTVSGARAVIARLEAAGAELDTVLITHAHPDHYFGARTLIERYPEARVIAAPAVVAEMQETASAVAAQQSGRLGAEFPGEPVIPETHADGTLTFARVELTLMHGLQGDTHPITAVHIPALDTLVTSDIGFSGTHVWTADSTPESRARWQEQLDALDAMNAGRVIPGHQMEGAAQTGALLTSTREYVAAFDQEAAQADGADALVAAMTARYPDAGGALFLTIGAQAVAGASE